MSNGFEIYEGTATESADVARITVRKGGLMVLTRAAVDLLGEDVTHVQLAYNAKTGAVGIRAADEEAPGCYTLRAQKKTPSRLVGGKRFFKHHDLDVKKARTYDAEEFSDGIVGFRMDGEGSQDVEAEATAATETDAKTKPKKTTSGRKAKAAA